MTLLMRRLERERARELLSGTLGRPIEELAVGQPLHEEQYTLAPVGGTLVTDSQLRSLRARVLEVAREHGYPRATSDTTRFDGRLAPELHRLLPMTPNEASQEEVWTYLTCCWLLDIAVWRFGSDADERRFIGNVNRNTFRRLWWRVEVLGASIPLEDLGEDELVNIMERPTIAGDRRLARAVAGEFLRRVRAGDARDRMQLMREAMKRLMRLSPFTSFTALDAVEVDQLVEATFDAAIAGLRGEHAPLPTFEVRHRDASADITRIDAAPRGGATVRPSDEAHEGAITDLERTAVMLARSAGRVTNITLREATALSAPEAREVLMGLVGRGVLAKRGVRRGTHYVIAEGENVSNDSERLVADRLGSSNADAAPEPGQARRTEAVTQGDVDGRTDGWVEPSEAMTGSSPPPSLRTRTRRLDGLGRLTLDAVANRRSPRALLTQRALATIRSNPGISAPGIAFEIGIEEALLTRTLPALEREGKVERRAGGWYAT